MAYTLSRRGFPRHFPSIPTTTPGRDYQYDPSSSSTSANLDTGSVERNYSIDRFASDITNCHLHYKYADSMQSIEISISRMSTILENFDAAFTQV